MKCVHHWSIFFEDGAQVGQCQLCQARKVFVPREQRSHRIPVSMRENECKLSGKGYWRR